MVKVSVIGATGYAGAELMRLLSGHKEVHISHAISKSFSGSNISCIYKNFVQNDFALKDLQYDKICSDSDIVFTCLPHGESYKVVPDLIQKGVKVIDLSADFRYKDSGLYEEWYKTIHPAKSLLSQSVFGLPEIYRETIKKAKLIGNPGCYASCAILAIYPLLKAGVVRHTGIIVDAKSGVSGAGRSGKLELSFCEVNESVKAYAIAAHRHTSEIEQEISLAAGKDVIISFTPHLLPINRGIICTIYLTPQSDEEGIYDAYSMYDDEPFISVYKQGIPEIKHVTGSNNCAIGFVLDKRANRLVVISCLDNLVKGAAGCAIQNLNLICGFDECEGLNNTGWYF